MFVTFIIAIIVDYQPKDAVIYNTTERKNRPKNNENLEEKHHEKQLNFFEQAATKGNEIFSVRTT